MALKKREKILGGAAAATLAVIAYVYLLSGSGGSLSSLRARHRAKTEEVATKQAHIARGEKAKARLAQWETHALPSNYDQARSKYQDWLRDLVERLRFRDKDIFSGEGQSPQGAQTAYTMFPFKVQGKVTLDQLVRFLYEFYSAGHLHRVQRLNITPVENSKNGELDVVVTIEALSLPDLQRTDKLSTEKPDRPPSDSLAVYEKAIVGRNIFASYLPRVVEKPRPKEAPRVETKPAFDHARHTKVEGITEIDGNQRQVWLHYLPSPPPAGKMVMLSEDETFDFGEISGKIIRIDLDEVEIEMGGRHYRVASGANLRDAKELPK